SQENTCAAPVALINGSFEEPYILDSQYSDFVSEGGGSGTGRYYALLPEDLVPGWKTTASDQLIEIWDESFLGLPALQDGIPDGKQVAELNATEPGALYQDVNTVPGQKIYWRLSHQGKYDTDTMEVRIGSAEESPESLPVIESLATGP